LAEDREAVFVTDSIGRFVYANEAACALLGYSVRELQRMSIRDTYAPGEVHLSEERMRLLHGGLTELHFRRRVLCRNRTYVEADIQWKLLDDGRYRVMMRAVADGASPP
jgi:PAS domain S-box-containing protein